MSADFVGDGENACEPCRADGIEVCGHRIVDARKAPLVLPIVHLNGTSRDELVELRVAVMRELRAAQVALDRASPNARDYYPEPGRFERARAQYARRAGVIRDLLAEIEAETEKILDGETS